MLETLTFLDAVLFLVGIVLMIAGSFPKVRERVPKLFLNGFLVTLAGLVSMLVAAFAFSPVG
ncbi:hypothetical protein BH24DEI2_BH24DEI2_09190 [soil metagenome]